MPRKKKNARGVNKPKRIKTKVTMPKAVLLPLIHQDDGMSPGVLKAVAEWKGGEYR